MDFFTHHPLLQILKGGNSSSEGKQDQQQAGMDIKTMFANIPTFLTHLKLAK
jgi:hypothetical protein